MAITAAEIKYYLSGGASNTDPNASLGGDISSTEITSGTLHNLFDQVSGAESSAGDTEYRCFYIKNTNATLTWQNVKIWVETETANPDTDELIGLGSSAVGGSEPSVADESTAPSGITFSQANLEANALTIGDIPAGSWKAVWVRRDVTAGASASSDSMTIRAKGDTAA